MLAWNPWVVPSFAATGVALGMAVLVYAARPWRTQNRWLAAAIGMGGLSAGLYFGLRGVLVQPSHAWLATAAGVTVLIVSPLPYLLFLSTLETPLVRPLRRGRVQIGLLLLFMALEAVWLTHPRVVMADVEPFRHIGGWNVVPGPLMFPVALLPLLLTELFGLGVAFSALRHARTPISRDHAYTYAVAFGVRDLLGAAFIVAFGVLHMYRSPLGEGLFNVGIAVIDGLFFVALAYAILQYQIFNIRLTIKRTIHQGTIGATFAAAFFLGSEGVEHMLSVDGTLAGLAVAGMVGLAFRRLQRTAARLAGSLFPQVSDTPEYTALRTVELYRAALEGGYDDGAITTKERAMLEHLRARLGIPEPQAAQLEMEVHATMTAPRTTARPRLAAAG